jgi:hypothetical protein
MQAIETFATITDEHHVVLDEALPPSLPNRVRVLVLLPNDANAEKHDAQPDETRWLRAASQSSAFSFLQDEEEIYSAQDGEPFNG